MTRLNCSCIGLFLFVFGACGGASQVAGPTMAAAESDAEMVVSTAFPTQVFQNGGVSVAVVYLEGEETAPTEALVRFVGTTHPLVGKTVRLQSERSNDDLRWKLMYDGKLRTLLYESERAGELQRTLFLPKTRTALKLQYDSAASQTVDTAAMISEYRRAVADGSLAALAKLNRPAREDELLSYVERSVERVKKDCRADISFAVDWSTVSDEAVVDGLPCDSLLQGVAKACWVDHGIREKIAANVQKISCGLGEAALQAENGVLSMSFGAEQRLSVSEISTNIRTLLGGAAGLKVVAKDKDGRLLVFEPADHKDGFYLGDGKVLYKLREHGSQRVWGIKNNPVILRNDDGWYVRCSDRKLQFRSVGEKRRVKVLSSAQFKPTQWQREDYALARDNRGTYYYVDRLREEHGGKGFRVFMGLRGQVKQSKLIDIVNDTGGMIFATKTGKLRLVLGTGSTAVWIKGNKKRELEMLPIDKNKELVYRNLGVYDGENFHTLCKD